MRRALQYSQAQIRSMLDYTDGTLVRKETGKIVRCNSGAYPTITIESKVYYVHHVVFLWHHGYLPSSIDHIDGNTHNNHIENLRAATHRQNHGNRKKPANNSSGFKGVSWHKASGKWTASIKVNYRQIHLGLFENAEDAGAAYVAAAKKYFQEFARAA